MKVSEYKKFKECIIEAGEYHHIWGFGFLFMKLTPKQHNEIWELCDSKSFTHRTEVTNTYGTHIGVVLPNGLVLLK